MDTTVFLNASGNINIIPIILQVMADGKTLQVSVDKDNKKQESILPPTPAIAEEVERNLQRQEKLDMVMKTVFEDDPEFLSPPETFPPNCPYRERTLCDRRCYNDPENQFCRFAARKLPGRPGLSIPDVQPGVPINLQLRVIFHPDKTIEVDVAKP